MWDIVRIVLDKAIDPIKRAVQKYFLRPEMRAHDASIFHRSNGLLSWDELESVAEQLKAGFLTTSLAGKVREYARFFADAGNQYLTRDLQLRSRQLVGELQGLRRFLDRHFSEQQHGSEVRLVPNLDVDIRNARQLCGRAKNRYLQYRQEIKARLIV